MEPDFVWRRQEEDVVVAAICLKAKKKGSFVVGSKRERFYKQGRLCVRENWEVAGKTMRLC